MKLCAVNATKNFLRKRAGTNIFTAVKEANIELDEGTLTVISGPSGSGKSTLLNMLSGLLPPDSGQILAGDEELYKMEDAPLSAFRNAHFGIIPQGQTPVMSLNVIENVLVPFALYKKQKGPDYEAALTRAEELLERSGLSSLKNEMPCALSGGEIRRMAVCRALLLSPEAVFADEPTGDLDDENTQIVMKLLKDHALNGAAVLVVTHDRQILDYADREYQMKAGTLEKC